MPFSDIIEQARAKSLLQRVLNSGRVPHAFLFTGPWGVGKTAAALVAARAICCDNGPADACEQCPSCNKARRFNHPDIHFFFPMPSFKKDEEAAKARRAVLDDMVEDPFYVIQFEKAHSTGIDIVRQIKRQTFMRPVESRYRVIVISRAEKMTEEASNSLLKVLEEPAEDVIFFLTAAKPDWLLPTISSRCREIAFAPLSFDAVAGVLEERMDLSPERASLAAALSRGSLAAALVHGEEDLASWRDRALELFDSGAPGDDVELHGQVQGLLSEGGRAAIARAVEIMRVWCRDLLLTRSGAPESLIANQDRRKRLSKEAQGLTVEEISRRATVLEDMVELVEANVNPSLILYSGVLRYSDPSLTPESIARSFPRSLFAG
jgi:DNA polymerase-3 subunit delta'